MQAKEQLGKEAMVPQFQLRFPERDLDRWAAKYEYMWEERLMHEIGPTARKRGYLTGAEFRTICEWKTPRSRSRCLGNSAELVKEATRLAFGAKSEELKIGCLMALSGVSWPSASVILHFCDKGLYPILDFRALWSLGIEKPPTYTFAFWFHYVRYMRQLHRSTGHSMRVLDRALWQFSKG